VLTFRSLALLAIAGIGFAACNNAALEQKVSDLETRVKAIEDKGGAPSAPGARPAGADGAAQAPQDPPEAMELYKAAAELAAQGKPEEAKAKLSELSTKYPTSRPSQAGARLLAELSVVGKEIADLKIDEWFQGKAALADNKATLLVFWEVWCPHCKREVPKLEATFNQYKGKGFGVIGLTKMSRDKTPEDVKTFISENKVTYPIAKESTMSDFFGVSGVPAAAVVKGGKVVWRGHPAQVNEEMINGWIN
jgi:thioredoxin-like negative regulator of GroEL